jgi:hypothetical protein
VRPHNKGMRLTKPERIGACPRCWAESTRSRSGSALPFGVGSRVTLAAYSLEQRRRA